MREIKFRYWTGDRLVQVHRLTLNGDEFIVEGEGVAHYANAKSLMQYTGLKDKNGREIYEGDLLRDRVQRFPTLVAFEDGGFVAKWNGRTEPIGKYLEDAFGFRKVIGNIYENPELLEVTK